MKVVVWINTASCKLICDIKHSEEKLVTSVKSIIYYTITYTFIDLYLHDLMLFDYMYNLILRTGQSPISLDNRLSTV